MIYSLIVCFLFTQKKFEPIDNTLKVNIKFYDWVFIEVQERCVMEFVIDEHKKLTPNLFLKDNIPKYILKLDDKINYSNCYTCREIACKKFKRLLDKDYIWLFWLGRISSSETRRHVYHALSHYSKCGEKPQYGFSQCETCFGLNQFWPISQLQLLKNRKSVLEKFDFDQRSEDDVFE